MERQIADEADGQQASAQDNGYPHRHENTDKDDSSLGLGCLPVQQKEKGDTDEATALIKVLYGVG